VGRIHLCFGKGDANLEMVVDSLKKAKDEANREFTS
jgi:hypothetical protein